jgi:hypothetical protein
MSRLESFIEDLNGAVRENPIAAGLIGAGIIWLAFGNSNMLAAGRKLPGAAKSTKNAVGHSIDAVTNRVGEGLSSATRQVRGALDAAGGAFSEGASEAASAIERSARAGYNAVTAPLMGESQRMSNEFARHYRSESPTRLTEMLERQPLLIAAIGLGVGAAIASAFPETTLEKAWIGGASDSARERLKGIAEDSTLFVADRVANVVEEVADEAVAQNLTPSAFKAEVQATVAKVKDVAAATRDNIKSGFPS